MNQISKRPTWAFLLIFLISVSFVLAFAMTVSADFGPKPSITIIVKNPPENTYYLDLMTEDSNRQPNLDNEDGQFDPVKFNILLTLQDGDWAPALVQGTSAPLFGTLTGTAEGKRMVHHFSYFGTPDRFKMIIVAPDNSLTISPVLDRTAFQMTLTYDYETGRITTRSAFVSYLIQILSTLIPTLIIEGIILLLFGFSLRKNWPWFLVVNLVTQVLLTAVVGTAAISSGMLTAILLSVPVEAAILIIETIAFAFLLRQHSKGRRIAYAITANLVSLIAGLIVMSINLA